MSWSETATTTPRSTELNDPGIYNGTIGTTTNIHQDDYADALYALAWILNRAVLPIIIFVGLTGNTLSAIVFLMSPLRRVTSSTVSMNE